jgi:hypothetical protein
MSGMRRTIAIALAAALLFAGGCGRQDRKDQRDRRDQRPAAVSTQTTPAQDAPTAAPVGGDDVDQLLDQVDQQLSGDAQPAGDED